MKKYITKTKLQTRDEFVLKWFMNKHSIKPGQYTDDLLYFFEQYNDSMRNGEYFEQAFMTAFSMKYNTDLTGVDGHIYMNNNWCPLESKKEMKGPTKKLDGKSAWSIHCSKTLYQKANDPNFYLLQFGFRDGKLVYALLFRLIDTNVLKNKTPHDTKKMLAHWVDFKDDKNVIPLFLNRNLIKEHCGNEFKNWLLSLRECGKQLFGVDIRKMVNLPDDEPELYYRKGESITGTPKFSAIGHTCLPITKQMWYNMIVPLQHELIEHEERALPLGSDVLYIRNNGNRFEIRSSIDNTKTKYRKLDFGIMI